MAKGIILSCWYLSSFHCSCQKPLRLFLFVCVCAFRLKQKILQVLFLSVKLTIQLKTLRVQKMADGKKRPRPNVQPQELQSIHVWLTPLFSSFSWKVPPILLDKQFSDFTPDITPIILAAHTNNYEIIKLLVQKGVSMPQPHEVGALCCV